MSGPWLPTHTSNKHPKWPCNSGALRLCALWWPPQDHTQGYLVREPGGWPRLSGLLQESGSGRDREGSSVSPSEVAGPWISDLRPNLGTPQCLLAHLPLTYPLPSTELSSSSSRSTAGLVRGGHDRVDTFRARTEPLG